MTILILIVLTIVFILYCGDVISGWIVFPLMLLLSLPILGLDGIFFVVLGALLIPCIILLACWEDILLGIEEWLVEAFKKIASRFKRR